jgi:predicted Ser/Thr protein kinase
MARKVFKGSTIKVDNHEWDKNQEELRAIEDEIGVDGNVPANYRKTVSGYVGTTAYSAVTQSTLREL